MPESYELRVRRFDPESGEPAYWENFDVELDPERSVLDGILQVRNDQDGSLAIRCSCRAAICGSCGVRINGKSALACNTRISDAAHNAPTGAVVVEPMGNMPVLKDLIVDMDAVHWRKIQRVVPWLLPEGPAPWRKTQRWVPWLLPAGPPPDGEYIVPAEAMIDVAQAMACIQCGACVS